MPQRSKFKKLAIALTLFTFVIGSGIPATAAPKDFGVHMVPQNFSALSDKVGPAVVNIQVEKATQPVMHPFSKGRGGRNKHFRDFYGPHFGNETPRPHRQSGLGTGFIIDQEGYIVTNNHVVEGADRIKVVLQDKREFEATIVGRDPQTDLALIKVNSDKDLPAVPLGKSSELTVGEWVVAIGNPFGLEHTVTAGIVSAKGRMIGSGPYDDYIQTDASINPAILASGQGIGFAIPIDMANGIVAQLKDEGKVTRGWLGVTIQDLKGDLAAYCAIEEHRGVLVT